jgi:2-polyprenyl-6-methoxyphenol hydroxylase-like FAD-dependent oxidoreductase
MKEYDVAVIGASVSGGTLASCLGRRGLSVAVIDKGSLPRRKACGEGLSNVALSALVRMGFDVAPAVESGLPYYGYRMDLGKRSFAFASGQKALLKGVGVQRVHLDSLILGAAAACPTVSTFLETSASGIERHPHGHSIQLSNGETISARQLILADGANSKNAALLGIPTRRKSKPLWGISFIMEGSYRKITEEVVVILKKGFEINCTAVSKTRLNITFLTEKSGVKPLQDPTIRGELLAEAMEKSHFSGLPLEKPLQVGPVSAARRPYVHESIMLLGDAAENLDPVAGMGMTHGILMAEIAAVCIISHFRQGVSPETAHLQYAKRAEQMSRPYRGFTRLTASLLRSPARGFLLPLLSATMFPGMIRRALDEDSVQAAGAASLPKHFLNLVGV